MPRILRIINRLNLGGPTYNAALLSRYLSPDYETMLVAGMKDESEASSEFILSDLGIEPVYIPDMRRELHPAKDTKAYKSISKIIRNFKPDIVHTHAAKAGALGRLAAINHKVPVVVHTFHGHVFHSYFSPVKTRIFLEIERYLARKSSAIVAISDKQKHELSTIHRVAPERKFQVVPLGFELHRFRQDQEEMRRRFRKNFLIDDDEIAIAITGRLVPVKNHEMFLKVLSKVLRATSQKVRAFIIGDGEERENLEWKARELNIHFTVGNPPKEKRPLTFTSWMTNINEVNAGMDILALTSLNEGTPVSLIEAQAACRPVVSTRVGGVEDIVVEGKTALLSNVNDIETFSSHLLRMIEGPEFGNGNMNHHFEFIFDKFNYTRLIEDMNKMYDKLLHPSTTKSLQSN